MRRECGDDERRRSDDTAQHGLPRDSPMLIVGGGFSLKFSEASAGSDCIHPLIVGGLANGASWVNGFGRPHGQCCRHSSDVTQHQGLPQTPEVIVVFTTQTGEEVPFDRSGPVDSLNVNIPRPEIDGSGAPSTQKPVNPYI